MTVMSDGGRRVENGQAPFAVVASFFEAALLSLRPAHERKGVGEDARRCPSRSASELACFA